MTDPISRRVLPGLAAAAAAAVALVSAPRQAQAQAAGSSWDTIMTSKRLRVGGAPSEPWYFKDNTGSSAPGAVKSGDAMWRGIGPRLGELVAKAMGVQLEMVDVAWGTAVASLQAGQIDTMFILDPTPERALAVDFVASPVLWYPIACVARDKVEAKTWADLDDPATKIAVVLGTSTDQTLSRLSPKASIQRFPTTGEMMAAYQSNRVDLVLTTGPTVDLSLSKLRGAKRLVPKPVVAVPAGAGVRKEADQRWNTYLSTCMSYFYNTGITQQVYDEYMSFRGVETGKATPIQKELW